MAPKTNTVSFFLWKGQLTIKCGRWVRGRNLTNQSLRVQMPPGGGCPKDIEALKLIDVLAEKRERIDLNHYLSQKHPLG